MKFSCIICQGTLYHDMIRYVSRYNYCNIYAKIVVYVRIGEENKLFKV